MDNKISEDKLDLDTLIKDDPVLTRTMELDNIDLEESEELTNEIAEIIRKKVMSKEIGAKHAVIALSRNIMTLSQLQCTDEQHFLQEIENTSKLVTFNILPALGMYHDMPEEEKKYAKVIFNDEFDKDNLSVRRLTMCAAHLTCQIYHRINNHIAIQEFIAKEQSKEIAEE